MFITSTCHRLFPFFQELTKLRIADVQGIEKPEVAPILKTEKKGAKKVPVAA